MEVQERSQVTPKTSSSLVTKGIHQTQSPIKCPLTRTSQSPHSPITKGGAQRLVTDRPRCQGWGFSAQNQLDSSL